ncbi:hypothetical protein [Teredinibacter franksiae]|nr:hypothetical protein [Teredinibacter franksiae]
MFVREGKDRLVPMGDSAAQWLNKYLEDVRPALPIHSQEALSE